MHVQDRIIETIKLLDEKSMLKLYSLALDFQNKKNSETKKRLNLENIKKSQNILSSIKGSLSHDIQQEREDRC